MALGLAFTLPTGAADAPRGGTTLDLSLVEIANGFDKPVELAFADENDSRLFVVENDGVIRIMDSSGVVNATPFLDIQDRVDHSSNEEGLLGLAFHPDYESNGRFFVQYTHTSGTRVTRISEFNITGNPDIADASSENILLTIDQHSSNHNAGGMHFSPVDGFLYVPMGDGGGAGDTGNHAQNRTELLGKIVRIDVDEGTGNSPDCVGSGSGDYSIPADNPFIDGSGGDCDEMWALGLRNPYRSGFDRQTGDLYIGDVGQGDYEEIDFQAFDSTGGQNYGWRCYEGNEPFNTTGCLPIGNYTFPVFVVDRDVFSSDCSIIGGRVYRGDVYPLMVGRYFTGDYCSGNFYVLTPDGKGGWASEAHIDLSPFGTAAISDGADGEIYVVNESNGRIYHLQEATTGFPLEFDDGFENP